MKRHIFILVVMLAGLSVMANAQIVDNAARKHPDSIMQARQKLMKNNFHTTDSVKLRKVMHLQQEFQVEFNKLMADTIVSYDEKAVKIKLLQAKRNMALVKVLKPDELRLFMQGMPRVAPLKSKLPAVKEKGKVN